MDLESKAALQALRDMRDSKMNITRISLEIFAFITERQAPETDV